MSLHQLDLDLLNGHPTPKIYRILRAEKGGCWIINLFCADGKQRGHKKVLADNAAARKRRGQFVSV